MSEGAKRGGGEKGLANSEKRKRGKGREREKGGENGAREGGRRGGEMRENWSEKRLMYGASRIRPRVTWMSN